MSARAWRAARLSLGLLLGLATAYGAWHALRREQAGAGAGAGAFGAADAAAARAVLERLLTGLASLQEADGGFALWSAEERPSLPEPEVKRTASSALAAWALVEGASLVDSPVVARARTRALDYLEGRLQEDGTFGRLPRNSLGAGDPGPEVTALAAGLIAFARSGETRFGLALGQGTRALAGRVAGGLRDGWQRALAAMAVDALANVGRGEGLGRDPRRALVLGKAPSDPDCGDYRLAEAIVRVVREEPLAGDLFPEAVMTACILREPPLWSGATTDVPAWLMQAWLAGRSRQATAWFHAALPALEESPARDGWVPGGIYADRVAQSAAAGLVLALGFVSQPVSP